MPYVTLMQSPIFHQITFDEIIAGNIDLTSIVNNNETNTRTYFSKTLNPKFLERFNIDSMVDVLEEFCNQNAKLYEEERSKLYDKFFIPKKSGGLREINAPKPALMLALRNLKSIFENQMFALYHTSAFAYVPGRSTIDAVKRHQKNESHWFLKTDFSDFFGNTTPTFLMSMLSMIFPFSEIVKSQRGYACLSKALDLCFLNGGLPQGTPISPMLTNLMMIPIDHRINNCLRDYKGHHYVYTRYADDSLFSSRCNFDKDEIIGFINSTLAEFGAPFTIKDEKTRYGSRAGSNWNLGVMLNKDNEITIGHKNKQRLRAMICNYIMDKKNGIAWDLHDVQVLRGLINYYSMIEKDYVDGVIDYNNRKFNTDVIRAMNADMNQN